MKFNLTKFCGEPNFTVWNSTTHTFGKCFEELVIVCGAHFLLLIVSLFHFCKHRKRQVQGPISHSPTLHVRFFVSFLLCLFPIIVLILTYFFEELTPTVLEIITYVIETLSWLSHSSFVWILMRLLHIHIRGPKSAVISVLTTSVALAIHVRAVIIDVQQEKNYLNAADEYVAYVKCALHLVYLISLIPGQRPTHPPQRPPNHAINEGDSEREPTHTGGDEPSPDTVSLILGKAEETANCFSKLFFIWTNPLMRKGYKGYVQGADDVFQLPGKLDTHMLESKFKKALSDNTQDDSNERTFQNTYRRIPTGLSNHSNMETSVEVLNPNSSRTHKKTSLIRALHKAFGVECYSLGILKFLADSLTFAGPILLNLLVNYMENAEEATWHGYVYAGGLFTSTFISSMLSTHFSYRITILGLKIRASLITSTYKKALQVSSVTLSKFSSGEVVNFMSTDTDRIVNFCPSFHQFWSLPVQLGVALFLLYQQVRLAFLAGIAFAILLIPVNKYLANKIGSLSTDMMEQKDSRVKVMSEILAGIRVIKFYAWEHHFSFKINELREAELKSLKGRKYLDAWCVFFWACTPALISILTFTTYVLIYGQPLTAAMVFTSIALFNILLMPLNAFPWVINGLVEAWVSIKRLQRYLLLEEQDLTEYYTQPLFESSDPVVEIQSGRFSWSSAPLEHERYVTPSSGNHDQKELLEHAQNASVPRTLELQDINVSIAEGSLVGVIGTVGCGKSSLLNAILAEMNLELGSIHVTCLQEGFGLVSQEVWIQHATVRENILFGKEYDEELYENILDACALREDLKILPAGDATEIGENGVTLSGGQKARVAFARAVYQDKPLYLLDDPLAAVDAHVAQHLFSQCIMGLLRHKTRVLCTHHTKFLQDADHVIVMQDGRIIKQGLPTEVLRSVDLKKTFAATNEENVENDVEVVTESKVEPVTDGTLMTEEEQEMGVVKLHVYKSYWRAVGHCLAPMVLLSLFLMQASRNMSDWWLSYWVTADSRNHHHDNASTTLTGPLSQGLMFSVSYSDSSNSTDDEVEFYLGVYGGIVGSNLIFALARAFLFAYGGICAAQTIHKHLLSSILKAPIRFFDVTPIGRIINRFSSDMYAIDDTLPFILNIFLAQIFMLFGSLAITCYGVPLFLVVLVPLAVIYYGIQKYYRVTSRVLKRISSVTLSPIYAHFNETVTGLVTIRALRQADRFRAENREKLETNQRAQLCSSLAGVWLSVRLQMIGVVMVTAVAFIAVLEHHFVHRVNPGLVGLAISYALSVTGLLSGVVQFGTETEKQMVSVERASHYIHGVPSEQQSSLLTTPSTWPTQGKVCFDSVVLQYREGLPNALNGVSFEVNSGEKIGIVGRTGSGKSSLFLALFRMVELKSGSITIDGLNIANLDLQDLRSKMAIIPQDPFLFSGTVRENLDPTNSYFDSELWEALARCHVKEVVERLGGLDSGVLERGKQFSVGQRQLLCLARALLLKSKILCIDEATASIDHDTDALIQDTIRSEFSESTVLTIAHRIHTVADSDRVLVMQGGLVAEFDAPTVLLRDTQSLYYALVNSS